MVRKIILFLVFIVKEILFKIFILLIVLERFLIFNKLFFVFFLGLNLINGYFLLDICIFLSCNFFNCFFFEVVCLDLEVLVLNLVINFCNFCFFCFNFLFLLLIKVFISLFDLY